MINYVLPNETNKSFSIEHTLMATAIRSLVERCLSYVKKIKDDNYLKCLLCLAKFLMIIAVYATYVYLPMVRWGPISTNIAESLLYNLLDYSAFLII